MRWGRGVLLLSLLIGEGTRAEVVGMKRMREG